MHIVSESVLMLFAKNYKNLSMHQNLSMLVKATACQILLDFSR